MNTFLYGILDIITEAHTYILSLNDAYEANLTDKQLHFIVIGIIGMAMIFIIHPLFTLLAKTNHVLAISWIYVFTLIILMTFAIEIGQKITHSGVMDFDDIVFGVWGFLLMFLIFALIRGIIIGIIHLVRDIIRK
jgi:glycopeptide antibiotics resistance protein